jgi:hypothetical protein
MTDTITYNIDLLEGEEVLFRYDVKEGWIRKKVTFSYILTNRRVIAGRQILMLEDISDIVSINQSRQHGGSYHTIGVYHKGLSSRTGRFHGKSMEFGDIVIHSVTGEDQIWHQLSDPDNLVKLMKSLRKARMDVLNK